MASPGYQNPMADHSVVGWAPFEDDMARMAYAYGATTDLGAQAGLSIVCDGEVMPGWDMAVGSVNAGIGETVDRHGDTRYGIGADAQAAWTSMDDAIGSRELGLTLGGEIGVGTADAGLWASDSMFSVGGSANFGEAALEGTANVGNLVDNAAGLFGAGPICDGGFFDADNQVRFGVADGVAAGLRVHYSDDDDDGVRELGVGLDVPCFSADMKLESFGHMWNGVTGIWDWMTG
jgi:hypothetical protein